MIVLTESFQDYQKKKGFKEVTVDAVTSASSCCRIWVPQVSVGPPKDANKGYVVFHEYGLTFYITDTLTLEPTLTFSHQRLLGRSRLEMLGYQIKRVIGFTM